MINKDGAVGTVQEVFGSPLTGNTARVLERDGTKGAWSIAGLCLGARPAAPRAGSSR